jgi:uncharacterized RDD family membrane protein YckC
MSIAPPPPVWPVEQAVEVRIGPPSGFWRRVVAYLMDSLIVMAAAGLVAVVFILSVIHTGRTFQNNLPLIILLIITCAFGLFVFSWLYEALLTSSRRGATLGKRAVGIRIVRTDGARLSFRRATGRHFLKTLITPLVLLFIGYLMAAFTARKQALHDIMASTLVVRVRQ